MSRVNGIRRSLWLLAPLWVACASVSNLIEEEAPSGTGDLGGGFSNPGARAGQHELDSELCWQGIRPESSDPAADHAEIEEAYERCMREKGWTREP